MKADAARKRRNTRARGNAFQDRCAGYLEAEGYAVHNQKTVAKVIKIRNPRTGRDPLVNARRRANGGKSGDILVRCRFCLKRFKPKSRLNRFCGARCRLLSWAVDELTRALAAGRAEGLRAELRKFMEAA